MSSVLPLHDGRGEQDVFFKTEEKNGKRYNITGESGI